MASAALSVAVRRTCEIVLRISASRAWVFGRIRSSGWDMRAFNG